jgi:hypothetical protein
LGIRHGKIDTANIAHKRHRKIYTGNIGHKTQKDRHG